MRPLLVLVLALVPLASCKKKPSDDKHVGWHQKEGWPGACYYPKNWDELGPGDRKVYRSQVLTEMMGQWKGERGDGIDLGTDQVYAAETALLGKPDWIAKVSKENLSQCEQAMKAGGDTVAWKKWLTVLPRQINEGDCKSPPLDYTLFDYLDIGKGWQIPAGVCRGDRISISGTTIDYYKTSDGGPWITVVGDTSKPAVGDAYPCTIEGCFDGSLILKFQTDAGVVTIMPVGQELRWEVPENGRIWVRINDDSFFDNKYKQEGSMIHHTGITYKPQD